MLALQESPQQYPLDENGVPIKPGYRKPFTSETARQSRAKAEANLKAERELYRKLGLHKQRKPKNLLYAVQQAIVRQCNASCEPNLPDCGMTHAKNAKLFTDIYMTLQGHNPSMLNRHKTTYKPHLQKSAMVEPVAPIEPQSSGNHASNPTTAHPAPEKAVSPATPDFKDDCPF